jgi:hypothetical protein
VARVLIGPRPDPRLLLDPRLLEEVVRLEMRRRQQAGDPRLADDYHRQADALYGAAPEQREAAFAALHLRLFRVAGLEARVTEALQAQGRALAGLESLTCLRTLRPEDEGADLDGRASGRVALLRIRAVRFLDPAHLARFLDHELVHLGDLLSAAFGHDPESLAAIPLHRRRLVQERYRAAWGASVDGRLGRQGRLPLAGRAEHRAELRRCFPALPDDELDDLLDRLGGDARPTHAGLLAVAVGRGVREPHQPGAPCPLCAFPTHHWTDVTDAALIRAIHLDVPDWEPDHGLCDRCFERYGLRSPMQT